MRAILSAMSTPSNKPLGRRIPTDWQHVVRYNMAGLAEPVAKVERTLGMPVWAHLFYDQAAEGACVGFGLSHMMSILNHHRYDARWLWEQAKVYDEWSDTNPGDDNGTSVRAGADVLRQLGHVRILRSQDQPVNLVEGIQENRWATQVDEMRFSISQGIPVTIGINWYEGFDKPQRTGLSRDYFVNVSGSIRGGHCVCVIGASDRRQAFCFTNNWGQYYPRKVYVSYQNMQRLIQEDGEATLVTDRL
jgi:hypothetical protein